MRERPDILTRLGELRDRVPSQRLGQLIDNALPRGKDLYYVEDEELIRIVEKFIRAVAPDLSVCE